MSSERYHDSQARLTHAVNAAQSAMAERDKTLRQDDVIAAERQVAVVTMRDTQRQWADEQLRAVVALVGKGEDLAVALEIDDLMVRAEATTAPRDGLEVSRGSAEKAVVGMRQGQSALDKYRAQRRQRIHHTHRRSKLCCDSDRPRSVDQRVRHG